MNKGWIVVLMIACVAGGYAWRGIENNSTIIREKVMAYGYNEVNNVWNRIRVNEQGQVVCSTNKIGE